jgi:hypothetical protein
MYVLSFKSIFFFIISFATAQNIYVKDSISNEPIAYANINYCLDDNIIGGDYTDAEGFLVIRNEKYNLLRVSCIGYENKNIKKELLSNTIYLDKKSIILNEVVVTNKNKLETIGQINEKSIIDIGFGKSLEVVSFIENVKNQDKTIYSLIIKINKTKKRTGIRLHFYKKNSQKFEPSEEISTNNDIEFIEKNMKGEIEILVKEHIVIPKDGLFVGVEILGVLNEKIEFEDDINSNLRFHFNCSDNKFVTFIKNRFKTNIWSSSEDIKKLIKVFKDNEFPNISFGIKVYD